MAVDLTDYQVLAVMDTHGGSFIKALAECYRRADSVNQHILRSAFGHYFREYERLAAQKLERDHARRT